MSQDPRALLLVKQANPQRAFTSCMNAIQSKAAGDGQIVISLSPLACEAQIAFRQEVKDADGWPIYYRHHFLYIVHFFSWCVFIEHNIIKR